MQSILDEAVARQVFHPVRVLSVECFEHGSFSNISEGLIVLKNTIQKYFIQCKAKVNTQERNTCYTSCVIAMNDLSKDPIDLTIILQDIKGEEYNGIVNPAFFGG